MRAHFLQHVPFEGLGSIEPWLNDAGYEVTSTRFFESLELPEPMEINFLIVLGGPMSVNDEDQFPWLISEKQFIRKTIEADIPVLGICLGAQLIANTLGSKVYSNLEKEIGWFSVEGVSSNNPVTFQFAHSFDCFHWHGETFDLPPGAIHLAKSEAYKNQGVQVGNSMIGLQFHLEMTPLSVRKLVENCRDELIPSQFVQSENEILSVEYDRYKHTNQMMEALLDSLHRSSK